MPPSRSTPSSSHSLPQHTGSLASAPRATSVHATSDDFVFLSDRFSQTTDLYAGTTFLARIPVVTTAFAAGAGQVHFVAGADRTLRAIDFFRARTHR